MEQLPASDGQTWKGRRRPSSVPPPPPRPADSQSSLISFQSREADDRWRKSPPGLSLLQPEASDLSEEVFTSELHLFEQTCQLFSHIHVHSYGFMFAAAQTGTSSLEPVTLPGFISQ